MIVMKSINNEAMDLVVNLCYIIINMPNFTNYEINDMKSITSFKII